jgi:hypothetical protein
MEMTLLSSTSILAVRQIILYYIILYYNPPGHHSKSYLEGWHNGIGDSNSASENDDGTYGNQCKQTSTT